MAEPWANPEATSMLAYTLEQGFNVAIYTTLYGIEVEEAERVRGGPSPLVGVHDGPHSDGRRRDRKHRPAPVHAVAEPHARRVLDEPQGDHQRRLQQDGWTDKESERFLDNIPDPLSGSGLDLMQPFLRNWHFSIVDARAGG